MQSTSFYDLFSTLCSLWNPSQCKTACRYPHPAGSLIQTLNPLTDCFRWVRPQRQLAAATDSWFVPDFMVQKRPTPLSARGITERDKWHHVCIWEQLWLLPTPHQTYTSGPEHCPVQNNTRLLKIKRAHWSTTENYQVTLIKAFGSDRQLLIVEVISFWWFCRIHYKCVLVLLMKKVLE